MKLKFYLKQDIASDSVNVFIVGENANGERFIAEPLDLKMKRIIPRTM
jgi:hypothetical protein